MVTSDRIDAKDLLVSLYNNSEITAIFINGPDHIYVKQKGEMQELNTQFKNSEEVWDAINNFLKAFGHKINPDIPLLDTRLPDGSWLNLLLAPAVLSGPVLTIRKTRKDVLTIDELIRFECISAKAADFLKACVKTGINILVSGGGNSGKTTLLNVLASFIPDNSERLITIEQSSGLVLDHKHVVTLTAGPDFFAGKERVSKKDLVINSFNMMYDRIIVNELDGGEVIPLLQAANGSGGIMASIFAINPEDAVTRLELLMMQSHPPLPLATQHQMIATGFDMIVQLNRLRDGSRKVMKITEVTGLEGEDIILTDIFEYQETGMENGRINGRTIATGYIPRFLNRLDAAEFQLSPEFFDHKN